MKWLFRRLLLNIWHWVAQKRYGTSPNLDSEQSTMFGECPLRKMTHEKDLKYGTSIKNGNSVEIENTTSRT
jgi:hypothetical protein